jgi:predicted nucleotidyltransferase
MPRNGSTRRLLHSPDVTEGPAVDTSLRERLAAAIASGPPLTLAVLFGSAAQGRLRADSDVDVAIVPTDDGLDVATEALLRRRLTTAARRDVDLVRINEASTLLKWRIATTGVPVFETRPGTFARFQAGAASEYVDYAPALAHFGELFRRRVAGAPSSRS